MHSPPESSLPLRLGIAGCLAGRLRYGAALAAASSLSVVGLADTDPHSARVWAREIGGAVPQFATPDALLAAVPDLDALLIISPLANRPAHIATALRTHKAVLCEVPFAPTLAETDEILRLAAHGGLLLMPVLPHRFDPYFRTVGEHIAAGDLGTIHQLRCVWSFPVTWAFALEIGVDAQTAEWSRLLEALACRTADLCRWWLGAAVSISADGFAFEADGQDTAAGSQAHIILTQDRGRSTQHFSPSRSQQPGERYSLDGAQGHMELTVTAGAASTPAPLLLWQRPGRRPERILQADFPATPRMAHVARMRDLLEHFAACVRTGAAPCLTAADARAAQEILYAAALSTQEGSKVSLPLKT